MLLIGTFRHVCIAASSLPAGALIICVLLCLATKSCVKTHCTDTNFLPSLSAAVGSNEPQRTIWIISILISSAWRLLILCGHLSVSNLPYLSSFIEIFSLNMLSIVSSSDNYIQHRNYFCAFALFSVVYMTTDVYVLQLRLKTIESSFLSNILRKKIRLMTFYLVCLLVLILCFWIHMTFCPPYAYTVFSAVEYAAIFANIIYHYTTSNTFEDISMRKMITYFCTGRTIPFVNMKSEQPLLEVK